MIITFTVISRLSSSRVSIKIAVKRAILSLIINSQICVALNLLKSSQRQTIKLEKTLKRNVIKNHTSCSAKAN